VTTKLIEHNLKQFMSQRGYARGRLRWRFSLLQSPRVHEAELEAEACSAERALATPPIDSVLCCKIRRWLTSAASGKTLRLPVSLIFFLAQ